LAKGDTEDMRKTDSNHVAASGGRCPPDPLGFSALALETAGACPSGQDQPGPLFTALQAAPKSDPRRIPSGAVADAEPTSTKRPHNWASALVSFCSLSLLLLTTNRLLLLSRLSPFARTATQRARQPGASEYWLFLSRVTKGSREVGAAGQFGAEGPGPCRVCRTSQIRLSTGSGGMFSARPR